MQAGAELFGAQVGKVGGEGLHNVYVVCVLVWMGDIRWMYRQKGGVGCKSVSLCMNDGMEIKRRDLLLISHHLDERTQSWVVLLVARRRPSCRVGGGELR